MFLALKLAKAGYYNGDPLKVLNARVDMVMGILDYELFVSDYNSKFTELNKAK